MGLIVIEVIGKLPGLLLGSSLTSHKSIYSRLASWAIYCSKGVSFLDRLLQVVGHNSFFFFFLHLDGTLFLPAQGRTPRVPVKAAKGSRTEPLQASSFMRVSDASKHATEAGVAVISA